MNGDALVALLMTALFGALGCLIVWWMRNQESAVKRAHDRIDAAGGRLTGLESRVTKIEGSYVRRPNCETRHDLEKQRLSAEHNRVTKAETDLAAVRQRVTKVEQGLEKRERR